MDVRKQVGGMVEAALNDAVDKALAGEDIVKKISDMIAKELGKMIGDNLAEKIKANYIDKIDGEDDMPDV